MKRLKIILILISAVLLISITIDAKTSNHKKSKTRTTKSVDSKVSIVGKFTADENVYTLLSNGKIKSPRGKIIGDYKKKGGENYYEIKMDEGDWYVIYMIVGNKVYNVGGGTDGLGIEKFSYNVSDNTVSVVNTTNLDDKEFMEYNEISSLRAPLSEFNEIGTVTWLHSLDSLIVELDIPNLSLESATIIPNLEYRGFGIEKNSDGEEPFLSVENWSLYVEFDPNYSNFEELGVLVKATLIDNNSDGADPLYGIGFLKGNELVIYYATVLYGYSSEKLEYMKSMNPLIDDPEDLPTRGLIDFPSNINKIMLKADNINNLNNFEAKLFYDTPTILYFDTPNADLPEYNDDSNVTPRLIEFTSEQIYESILEITPISIYESSNGEKVKLQLIKSPKVDQFGTWAIAIGKIYDENSEEDFLLEPITGDNLFSICGFYGMEMGLTKWNKDILKPEHNGKVIEMPLKERRFFYDENEINY